MKLGVENRNQLYIAIGLGVVALFMVWRTFFSGDVVPSQPSAAAQPSIAAAGPPARRVRGGRRSPSQNAKADAAASLDPRLRFDLLKASEQTEYKGSGRNIFRAEAEPPVIIPKAVDNGLAKKENTPPPPPRDTGPPPPPQIPLKFFGLATRPGEPRQAFLMQNDDVFIAKEGDVVNRRYKVVKITPNAVEIEDLLGNNKQTIPLSAN